MELKANPKPPATQTVVTGLGAAVQVTPQTPPASDTGEPETADAALDDAINALLPK